MVESAIAHMVKATLTESGDLKTLLFTTSVENATRCAELLNAHRGGCARSVNSETPIDERRITLSGFERWDFQFLTNVGIATEGYDCPNLSCIAQGRPTKSRALHAQIIGRGLRPVFPYDFDPNSATSEERVAAIASSSKPHCIVLEFTGNSGRHSLVSSVDVLGGKYEDDEIEEAKRRVKANPGAVVQDALEEARTHIRNERARKLLLAAQANYSKREYDPFKLLGMKRSKSDYWDDRFGGAVPSEAQMYYLKSRKVYVPTAMTKAQASRIIGELKERERLGRANYNQTKELGKYGLPTDVSYQAACDLVWEIRQNKNSLPPQSVIDGILAKYPPRERQPGEDG